MEYKFLPDTRLCITAIMLKESINSMNSTAAKKSGWMYSVNGVFPNYGASSYNLRMETRIEWVYTCNLGDDVGNHYEEK